MKNRLILATDTSTSEIIGNVPHCEGSCFLGNKSTETRKTLDAVLEFRFLADEI